MKRRESGAKRPHESFAEEAWGNEPYGHYEPYEPYGEKHTKQRKTRVTRAEPPSEARRRKIPTTGLEVLRAEARDVPTASSPSVREAGEARACAASAARPISAERSEAEQKRRE